MTTAIKYIMVFIALTLVVACSGNTAHGDNLVTYETYHNSRYDYTVEYPNFLIAQGEAYSGDGQKFFSEDQSIKMLVYYQFKNDFINIDGENLTLDKAYQEDLSYKQGVTSKKLEKDHYLIESKVGNIIHTHYVVLNDNYFNIYFEYPASEKDRMKGVIEHVIKSFKIEVLPYDDATENAAADEVEDSFIPFLKSFLNDNYWGKNFNTLLRNKDKTLENYIDPKMDVRRYYNPGTITRLGTRDEDFGFAAEDDFVSKPKPTGELIFEYVNDHDDSTPCELIYSENDDEVYLVYYRRIKSIPDVVVNNETFETRPVRIAYAEAEINAVYLPDVYNNPRGFYFLNTRDGWKLAFVDDSFCGV